MTHVFALIFLFQTGVQYPMGVFTSKARCESASVKVKAEYPGEVKYFECISVPFHR